MDTSELKRFAERSHVAESTVLKNYKAIPGITKTACTYSVAEGTRYPYSMSGKTKLDAAKRRFYLLDAIFHDRYIDHIKLRCERIDFETFLKDLLDQGFIQKRECANQAGANGYLTTPRGDSIFEQKRTKPYCEFARVIGTLAAAYAKEKYK